MSDRFPLCDTWATVDEAKECADFGDATDEAILKALQSATYVLYRLTDRRYPGICEDFVRPPGECDDGRCRNCCACCCHGPSKITLGAFPIREIVEVEIDGEILDPSEYRILNRRYLVRMADADGKRQNWPRCQRLDLPLGEEGTWGVHFLYGQTPPQPGVDAASLYAVEWAKACGDSAGECKLPARVQSIARQGVTMVIGDPRTFLESGLTGLGPVDSWIAAERRGRRSFGFVNPDAVLCDQFPARIGGEVWQS